MASDISAKQNQLARADLTSEEGVKAAIGLQKEIVGLNRAIETLVAIANGEATDE